MGNNKILKKMLENSNRNLQSHVYGTHVVVEKNMNLVFCKAKYELRNLSTYIQISLACHTIQGISISNYSTAIEVIFFNFPCKQLLEITKSSPWAAGSQNLE